MGSKYQNAKIILKVIQHQRHIKIHIHSFIKIEGAVYCLMNQFSKLC